MDRICNARNKDGYIGQVKLIYTGGGYIGADGFPGFNAKSDYKVEWKGRMRSVRVTCISNCASFFIKAGGQTIYFD